MNRRIQLQRGSGYRRANLASILTVAAAALFLCGTHLAWTQTTDPPAADAGFERIAEVLRHPRCRNCHQTEVPLQGDAGRPHVPRAARGPDNLGTSAMRCGNCHRDANNATSGIPGAPQWQLAPASMAWTSLSIGEMCRTLKDPVLNGNRSLQALIEHLERDPLVLWAWEPGRNRSPVPMPHKEYVGLVKSWAEAGGACPG